MARAGTMGNFSLYFSILKINFKRNKILFLVKDRINKYVNKIANEKRYKTFVKSSTYSVWNSPIYHSQKVYNCCLLANKMRDTNKRLAYLDMASQNLELLESSVETFYSNFRKVVKDKFIILLTEKIDYQKTLLSGCIRKFKEC